jgi:hypothetical protein
MSSAIAIGNGFIGDLAGSQSPRHLLPIAIDHAVKRGGFIDVR